MLPHRQGGSVYAYGGGGECAAKKEKRMRAKVERVLDEVDATDSQRATIEAEADNAIASWLEFRSTSRALRGDLMNEWKSESIDREAMVRLVDERIAALRALR